MWRTQSNFLNYNAIQKVKNPVVETQSDFRDAQWSLLASHILSSLDWYFFLCCCVPRGGRWIRLLLCSSHQRFSVLVALSSFWKKLSTNLHAALTRNIHKQLLVLLNLDVFNFIRSNLMLNNFKYFLFVTHIVCPFSFYFKKIFFHRKKTQKSLFNRELLTFFFFRKTTL